MALNDATSYQATVSVHLDILPKVSHHPSAPHPVGTQEPEPKKNRGGSERTETTTYVQNYGLIEKVKDSEFDKSVVVKIQDRDTHKPRLWSV